MKMNYLMLMFIIFCFRAEEKDVGSRLEKSKRHLRDLESSRSNRLKRFGGWVPDLLEKIEIAHKRGQFHEKPRGPFGKNRTFFFDR